MEMSPARSTPLASTLVRKVFAVYFALAFGMTLLQLALTYQNTAHQVIEEMDSTAKAFEPGISLAVWNYQEDLVKSVMSGMLEGAIIVATEVKDSSAKLDVKLNKKAVDHIDDSMRRTYDLYYSPVPGKKEIIGTMTLYSSHNIVIERVKYNLFLIILMATIKTLGLWLIIMFFAKKLLAGPLQRFTDQIGKLNLSMPSPLEPGAVRSKEFIYLYNAFNAMIKEIFEKNQKLTDLAAHLEQRVAERTAELHDKNQVLKEEIHERQKAEAALQKAQADLVSAARRAGMAEIATNVLHNVGNVLNSVNVSTDVISRRVHSLKISEIIPAIDLLEKNKDNLIDFVTHDKKGAMLPLYLRKLAGMLTNEQQAIIDELRQLIYCIEHLKYIVAAQQEHTGKSSITEEVHIHGLIEDALRINSEALERHRVRVVRDYEQVPVLPLDKNRILQILVNLISNAIHAMDGKPVDNRQLTVRVNILHGNLCVAVQDQGEGISSENLTRIFAHGFTTRKGGHGFGLHSSINAAREMGGSLVGRSDGPGLGATFVLEIPVLESLETA